VTVAPLSQRSEKLLEVRLADLRSDYRGKLTGTERGLARKGMFGSGLHVSEALDVSRAFVVASAEAAWESVVRAHQSLGSPTEEGVSSEMKRFLSNAIRKAGSEADETLTKHVSRIPNVRGEWTVRHTVEHQISRHDVEVDIYLDSTIRATKAAAASSNQYHFYSAVGAVQTGGNASASVVQRIEGSDKGALVSALGLVQDALERSAEFDARTRAELLEVTKDCQLELSKSTPNSTKLMTMFQLLASSVQAIPNAQPAYQAIKSALMPFGIALP
jgi:hypothetical protein